MSVRMMAAGLGMAVAVATASPALGKPGSPPGKPDKANSGRAASTTTTATGASSTTAPGGTATTQPMKAPKRFVHVGTVKALGAGSLTIQVQGGNQKAKGSAVTVGVAASARITRNGKRVPLAALEVGDHVQAKGSRDVADEVKAQRRSTPSSTAAGSTPTSSTSTTSTTSMSTTSTTVS